MMDEKYLNPYRNWAPTPMDQKGAFLDDERLGWTVVMSYTPKIASILDESNWILAQKILAEDNENFSIISVGHWATDIDILLVNPDSKAGELAEGILSALADYPVLNDMHYSEMQHDAIYDAWETMSLSDRIYECSCAGVSIFGARDDHSIPERVYDQLSESYY